MTLEWLVEALKDKSLPFIDDDELRFRNAIRDFFAGETAIIQQVENIAEITRRLKRLEQFHCEHEFANKKKGCLESIFCSKCGALHPDWKEWSWPFSTKAPLNSIYVGGKHYRTKASKLKEEKRQSGSV
jgi:hypothetical protein